MHKIVYSKCARVDSACRPLLTIGGLQDLTAHVTHCALLTAIDSPPQTVFPHLPANMQLNWNWKWIIEMWQPLCAPFFLLYLLFLLSHHSLSLQLNSICYFFCFCSLANCNCLFAFAFFRFRFISSAGAMNAMKVMRRRRNSFNIN